MKTIIVELGYSSSLFGEEHQRSKQDVSVNVEGLEGVGIEGQFSMRVSVSEGTNFVEEQKMGTP